MKKLHSIIVILVAIITISCEKVTDVNLNTAPPKLVVDASITWQKGTSGNEQKIKLTTTTSYYTPVAPAVSGATVTIKSSDNIIFDFIETPNTGDYICSSFIPIIGETYTLTINYNGQILTATETLKSVPVIDKIEQEVKPKFSGDGNQIDVKTYFTDPVNSDDFYLTKTQTSITAIPEFRVTEDTFFQGNQIFDLYQNENIVPGNVIEINLYGISQRYFNYMTILTSIAGNAGGGPFSTPPSTLRGNVINTTNPANYVLGYFSISEVDKIIYTVQ